MLVYDRLLVAPSRDELDDALGAALVAVHRGGACSRIPWSTHEYAALAERIANCPEGSEERSNPRGDSASEQRRLYVTWWADWIGRRHVRVASHFSEGNYGAYWPLAERAGPALLRVYPEAGWLLHREDTATGVLVLCLCGAVGTPEELAWMGSECGPCHDRRAAAVLPRRPWDLPTHTFAEATRIRGLHFLDDGTRLLITDQGSWYDWNLTSGQQVRVAHLDPDIRAWSPDSTVFATADTDHGPGLHLVRDDSFEVECTLDTGGQPLDRVHFSPLGRYVVARVWTEAVRQLHVWDRHTPATPPLCLEGSDLVWAIAPDEQTLYVARTPDRFEAHPLPPGTTWEEQEVEAPPADSDAILTGLYLVPDEGVLVLRLGEEMRAFEIATGRLLHRREVQVGHDHGRGVTTPDGRVLVVPTGAGAGLGFVRLPELTPVVRLLGLGDVQIRRLAASDQWLALAGSSSVRLVPWPPLLEWFARQ